MAVKHLILVHGRAIKPAGTALAKLARKAVMRGLERADQASVAQRIEAGQIKFSSAYYGDISNEIEAKASEKTAKLLTAKNDPIYSFRPCFPIAELEDAYALTDKLPNFTKTQYHKVLAIAEDWRLLDEAASVASLFGQLFTFGLLNSALISAVKSDLTSYLTSQTTGTLVRQRLGAVLEKALLDGDDICLVTHSLGCIVAYDMFWKYSFRSEYASLREKKKRVRLWLTMGCPLGEAGVRRNLLDGRYLDDERFPRNQFLDWVNVHAEDDFISHIKSMRQTYSIMPRKGYCRAIEDKHIYNCWHYSDVKSGKLVSNPHDMYGYLMNPATAGYIAKWAG
jgi:hypothetical protein